MKHRVGHQQDMKKAWWAEARGREQDRRRRVKSKGLELETTSYTLTTTKSEMMTEKGGALVVSCVYMPPSRAARVERGNQNARSPSSKKRLRDVLMSRTRPNRMRRLTQAGGVSERFNRAPN